jgi:hypothetical protein
MNNDNRRSELRVDGAMAIFVEIRAADPVSGHPAEIIACSGVDLSAGGLQVELDRPLPVGSILRLGADARGNTPAMYVVGEVRWSRPTAQGHAAGFAFFDSDGTDIIAWKKFIAGKLNG